MSFLERLPNPAAVAHRGGAALWPENTLLAFRSAVRDYGIDVLELDLHVSKDGVLVVSHDPTLERCTDGAGPLSELTVAQLQALDAGYHTRYRGQGARIPTFEELLTALPEQLLNVELKPDVPGLEQELARVLRQHQALDRVCIGSELDEVAERLVQVLPQACHFYPAGAAMRFAAGVWGLAPLEADPRFQVLDVPQYFDGQLAATPELFQKAASLNVPVMVWVVDEPDEMRRLLRDGARGIMTDRPDLLRAVLKS
jgi:glycerophosphoryl diester phosphodiesterase